MGTNSGTSTTLSAEEWKKKQQSSNNTSTQNKGTSTTLSAEEWKTSASYNNDSALKVNSFVHDANAFFSTVGTETTSENIFNAADFFEERKKQAEELKQRAADLSEYMANHMDSYTQESYDSLMEILSTFDTSVDDVMTRYQPSLDSKAGMAAYEDEYRAAMERNAQQQQVYEIGDRYSDYPVGPAYDLLQLVRSSSMEDSSRAVTDNWTAEQLYRLGLMQNSDPIEAQKYASEVNAGRDPYILYQQQEQQKAARLAMDLDSEKREIDQLKADLEDYTWNTDYDATSVRERKAFDEEIKRREKEISDREQEYNLAKREQESEQLASAANNSDFTSRSGYVSSGFEMPAVIEDADPDELVYEYINNPDVRSQINKETTEFAAKGYDLLDEKEVGLYNYYYATEGPEKAQQYLDNIQDTLNQRFGVRGAEAKKDSLWKQYMAGVVSGYSNAVTSPQYFFDKESDYINTSPFQYMSAAIREDLADTGAVLPGVPGGASLGQIGYDIVNTTANMAPSILLSTAAGAINPLFGKVVGAATMGSSAAGGAYQQALNAGYSKEQSRAYAALSGAAETGMEYLLGGISKLGGEIPQRVLKDIVSGVDNAVARAAIKLGGSMVSEGFEEGLQEVITPWLENLILYADKDVDLNEVAYSTLLGALSGGFMEGTGVISTERSISKIQNQLKDFGAKGNTKELAELIVKHRSGEELSQEEYIKLAKSEPAMQVLNGVRNTDSDTDSDTDSGDGNENESVAKDTPVTTPKVSSDGKAIQISTNETIETMDFASVNNGKATIQLKSGDTAEYSDVSFASEAEANQFYAAASLPGIDTENANDLLHTIQDADAGKDVDSVVGIREAYGIGYFLMQESDLENGDAGKLSPELRKAVFDIGRKQRVADAMVKDTANPVTAKPSAGYRKVVFEGKTRKITKKQKAEIEFVDYIAENLSGNTAHVFESYKGRDGKYYYRDNNGKVHRAPNGMYVNGEIWLDLNSGDNQEGLMLNTFAHEMYHHIEKYDKAKAQELAEFVVKELGKKSVDDAVAEQIKKARKAGLGESYFQSRGMTAEQARNEVYMRGMSDFVADSLETMFTRGDPAKAIANLKKENRTLFDEIKAFIDKWVSKLKEFYSDKTISEEGAKVAQLEKFEQLQQLFMEGVQSAGENYNAALESITPGEAAIVEGKRDKKLSSIVDEIQNTLPRTEAEISEEQVKQADRDLEANFSLRNSQTDTEQFRIWFNGSKVVNADGSPKVMYHGTSSYGFSIFNTYGGKFGLFGKGSYFTENPDVAESYTKKGKGQTPGVYDVYLNIKNPIDMDAKADIEKWIRAFDEADLDSTYLTGITTNEDAFRALKENLQDEGYVRWEAEDIVTGLIESMGFDGITHIGGGRYGTKDGPRHRVYIAFEPEQIKSASGNNGNYDPDHPNIYYSLRNEKPLTNRQILEQLDIAKRKPWERDHIQRYQERRELLSQEKPKLETVNARIEELSADPKQNKAELTQLKAEARALKRSVDSLSRTIREQEQSEMFKRIVTEERLRLMKETGKNAQKSYKNEQRKMVEAMNLDQRMIREELTGTQSVMSIMEDEFVRLAKDLEAKKIDLKTMQEMFLGISKQYDKDTQKWLREYRKLMSEYRKLDARNDSNLSKIEQLEATIQRQRADAKAKITQVRETQEVQKQRKHVEDNAKKLMRILTNPTKDAHAPMALQEPLQKFLDSIEFTSNRYASGGSATIKDRSYINALAKVRDAIKGQRTALTTEDGVFTLDVPPEFTEEIDKHINMVSDATEGLDLTTNRIYEMTSAELKDLNYILNTINKAIRDIDRMHMQGEKARTSGLARDTMQEMQNRKPIKGEKGNWFVWNNYTPFQAFRRYGKAALKIFDGLKAGQAKLARNIDSVVKFTEKTYTAKEVKEWEHNRHEIKLDSGKTVTMSSAQIMTFWCLSHRDQAIPHMQGAGIRMTTLEKFVSKANSQKELVQKDHFSLTLEDVNRINKLLTDRQRTVAREMQQFMQNFGGKLVNEISMARWDFMAATEKDYFPIDTVETSRDVKNPDQKKTSLFALLNKSFTKAPVQNARNAMVVDSIFNVFANHMSEVAEYNAFALPLVDTMKWFNYRENVDVGEGHIHDVGVNRSIRDTLGTEAIQYFVDLMTDINSSQKAGRHEDFFGKILGRSKAASVAWNTRVAIQQISALPRASMILNYKSLIKGASKVRLKYATQEMMKYSGIALWKSMGYYDLNVGKSVERQIKGDTSIVDKFNEVGMWLPGKMDERTWARIWIATKDQVQNTTHLTGEELLQATAKKFEEVVYETQVVDSVLTKSSFMRDKNLFIKEATSFMAEPTLAINILMSAFQDYEEGHSRSEKVKRGLMIGFTGYALAGVVNALLSSLSDAWRDDDEFEEYWEKYRQALFGEKFIDGNLFSELNPIEKIAFVKDILSVVKGNEPHSTYSKLMTDAVNLINSYQSIADGKGSKTAYGVVYQTLQYLSTASGVGMSNMTREVIDFWNNTIGKINPEQRILRYKPDNGDELLNAIQKGTEEDIQRVFGRFENQQEAEGALQRTIREKYKSGDLTREEAEELLTTNFDREDEHEVYWLLEEMDYAKEHGSTDGYAKYGTLYEAVESGGDYESEIARLMEHGAEASTIRSQITKKYHDAYLKGDEAVRKEIQGKLQPVLEAAGMDVSDIEDKFSGWDFEAEYGMTYSEMKSEYRNGDVTENEMRNAMKFYGLKNFEVEETMRSLNDEIAFVNKYDMTLSEMKDSYDDGNVTRNQMTNALVFTGMTQNEAKKWVTQRDIENRYGIDYAKLDDAYKHNDISRTDLYNAMIENGATKQEADDAILGYDWLKKHVKQYPDLTISVAKKFAVRISADQPDYTLEDFNVKVDDYIEYSKLRPDCKGVDNNGDGQADSGTKRDAIFKMIDSLPISSDAKDGLALIDYGMKSIRKNAPWH